jgi:TRAP-type mannitol/chloroaromatic compound transport system permease small subunit
LNPIDRLSIWIGNTFSYVFLIAVALTCYEVVMDFVFRAPTIWVHDSTIMLSALGFLFGGAYALQQDAHIRITSLYQKFSPNAQRWCDAIGLLLALFYLTILAYKAGEQAFESIMIVERSGRAWNVPIPMVVRNALFLGTVLLIAQALTKLWTVLTRQGPPTDTGS